MMPMVKTATMMRPSEWELPFWNSSQTNLPKPGFCASISAAIKTIQPTPRDNLIPVKMYGRAEGRIIFLIWVPQLSRNTLPTLTRSLSIDETPTAVLISVGQSEHSVTVMAEVINDFSNQESSVVT